MKVSKNPFKNKVINNILKLMSATMIAQVISFAFSPILTRIYTPEEYGLLTLFTTFVAILISFGTGRYEVALVLPKKNEDSKALLFGTIVYLILSSTIILLLILLFHDYILKLAGNKNFSVWLYFVPVSILIYGVYQNLNYWNNRFKNYNVISFGRITEAISLNIVQLILGLLKLGAKGLILGYVLSQVFATIIFSIGGKENLKETKKISFKNIKKQMKVYKEYPLYNMPSGLLDIASIQIPNLFISKFFGATSLGHFSLTLRIVNAPLIFISTSVSQVFFQKLNEMHQKGEKIRGFIIKSAGVLSVISLFPFILLFFWGPDLFSWIFGEKWVVSGELAKFMSFAVCVRLVVSPLSPSFFVLNRVRLLFVLQMSRFITTATILLIGSKFTFYKFVVLYSIHEVIFYVIYFILILSISSPERSRITEKKY